jgi:hypothetical protein
VAADGDGENGLYTKHLLAAIRQPGLPVEQLFKQVRIGVTKETGDRQIPWESSSLKGDFYFIPEDRSKAEGVQKAAIDKAVTDAVKEAEARGAKERAELQKKAADERAAMQAEMKKLIEQLLAKQKADLEDEIRRRTQGQASPAPDAAAQAEAAKRQAELEAKQKAELAARQKAEQEARLRAEAEARQRAELEAKQRAEREALIAQKPAPALQVASTAPTIVAAAAGNPHLPKAGDTWT